MVTILVFIPTFSNSFQTEWDDQWAIIGNPFVLSPTSENLKILFTTFYYGQYAPINVIFYWLLYEASGFNPMIFHAASLIIHILNAIILYKIISKFITQIKPGYSTRRTVGYAFFTALVFAIHPLQVESVAWASATKVVLYSLFYLSAIRLYIYYLEDGRAKWLWLIGVLYILAIGTKEQAIILPVSLLAIDYIYGRFSQIRIGVSFFKQKVILEKLTFFVLAFVFWYFSASFNVGSLTLENTYPLDQRLLMTCQSIVDYIFRVIAPVKLQFFYFFPIGIGEQLSDYYWVYAGLVLLLCYFVYINYKKNNKLIIFGILFFLINIALVLHILPLPRKFITADRYMYLSIIGPSIIGAWFIDYLMLKFQNFKNIFLAFTAIYLICLGTKAFYQTQKWKDSDSLKQEVEQLIRERSKMEANDIYTLEFK
ncbi:hypothetical protein [Sinomicrobium sp. M5D2P17]